MNDILRVSNLKTGFRFGKMTHLAVDDVSFSISKGETLGIVGESGSGKSVTALSILKLIDTEIGEIVSGNVFFEGEDILAFDSQKMRAIRGRKIGMIFQEPMTSLNPLFTIGFQIGESLSLHLKMSKADRIKRIIELLDLVKIPDAKKMIHKYPHELSGGMRQRVMIAMALSCEPHLLIADEPTTALDVTVQAQILNLISEIQKELGMALMLITHDLGVVSRVCDRVLVLYGGRIAEEGPVQKVFENPAHPYTEGLLKSIPEIFRDVENLATIRGSVPTLGQFPKGCRFQNRCDYKTDLCSSDPKAIEFSDKHSVNCFHPLIDGGQNPNGNF